MNHHHRILHEMLCIPTAPFAEHFVIDYVERFCTRRGVKTKRDAAGNVLAHVKEGSRRIARPACITSHLDHPGFVADRMVGKSRLKAFWRGGVPPEYFVGAKVRLFVPSPDRHGTTEVSRASFARRQASGTGGKPPVAPARLRSGFGSRDGSTQAGWRNNKTAASGGAGRWIRGVVRAIKTAVVVGRERVDTAEIDVAEAVPQGSIGMWDLPDPVVKGTRIYARGCDDIAGASAMLCAIDELSRGERPGEAYFLFTRAEEVGFIGAIAAAKARTIPKKCYVVAMENSSERPFAKIGDGPICRVGDKASAFTPAVTAHCHRIARELAARDKSFIYQRKLMDGGTCESSAYCSLGYEATGLCVALGNYHNVDAKRKRLAPEYIDLKDFDNVVKWFVALACTPHAYTGQDEELSKQIAGLEKAYKSLLRATRERAR